MFALESLGGKNLLNEKESAPENLWRKMKRGLLWKVLGKKLLNEKGVRSGKSLGKTEKGFALESLGAKII